MAQRVYIDEKEQTGVHPQKFMLWVAMGAMSMFFAALTSTLVVKKGDFGSWENFKLPHVFFFSTLAVIAVSVCLHFSLAYYRKSNFNLFRWLLAGGMLCALAFLGFQAMGWHTLKAMGFPITGNLSGSFIYLITYMHAAHIVLGWLVLFVFFIVAVRERKDEIVELRNIINPKRQLQLELLVMFWHYIDAVWLYLYVFFLLNY
jgi:cytochrome c oxidase subunit 3